MRRFDWLNENRRTVRKKVGLRVGSLVCREFKDYLKRNVVSMYDTYIQYNTYKSVCPTTVREGYIEALTYVHV